MNSNQKNNGYILVLTLLIISLSVMLVTYIFNKGTVYTQFARTIIDREKAKMAAFSGVQLAMSQLAYADVLSEEQLLEIKEKKGNQQQERDRLFLINVLSHLNQWQTIVLDEAKVGIEGKITIALSCEDGKININQMFDFDKHLFINEGRPKGDWKKISQELYTSIKKVVGGEDLFTPFEKFLKDRQYKVNDVTELLTVKAFELFKGTIFYDPALAREKKKKAPIFLTDIFTLWSKKAMVEPWLFSYSMGILLGFEQPATQRDRETLIRSVVKEFKTKMNWAVDWDKALKPLYGKTVASLPKELTAIFNPVFEPSVFSVVSYGAVGKITQKIFAIVERQKSSDDNGAATVKLRKVYWL